jgi:hypothetical protein
VATWGSEVTLVDFGADSITYIGSAVRSGTDIHILVTKADYADSELVNVYYFIYKTATGAVTNHSGSYSVASGSLPVTLANADANCRLFEHSGLNDEGGAPSLCFDSAGDQHILFKDGTAGAYTVKHIKITGGVVGSPNSLGTVDSRYNCPVAIPLANGKIEAWYPIGTDRFGDLVRVEWNGSAWGSEEVVLEADADGLGNPHAVRDGQMGARVIFCEALESALDSGAGGLRTYLYGSGGTIAYATAPAAATTPDTLQLNAENLQLNGENLTLGV